jgi:Putative transposase
MIVPGGGVSDDGTRWIGSPANFLVHVHVLARLFRGKFIAMLNAAHAGGLLKFFNTHAGLADRKNFKRFLGPLRHIHWRVHCKPPFAGPSQVLRYLSRYMHRVAISNRRLVAADDGGIAFRWKDYRANGKVRWKTMTLAPAEFIRRFLIHVLPKGFHRIRHYGLFANGNRKDMIARAHQLLGVAMVAKPKDADPSTTIGPADAEQRRMALRPCPLLWRAHAHHRGVRPRRNSPVSAIATRAPVQGRTAMTATTNQIIARTPCWPPAGNASARLQHRPPGATIREIECRGLSQTSSGTDPSQRSHQLGRPLRPATDRDKRGTPAHSP